MTTIPLDWVLIGFTGNQFKGEIVPELYSLVERGIIRIVDLVFVAKDANGEYTVLELNDLPDEEYAQFVPLADHLDPLFTPEDVQNIAQRVPANSAALSILWQNTWTETFRRAVENANGILLAQERIPGEVLDEVYQEIAAAQA
jgi:hypothetical protein